MSISLPAQTVPTVIGDAISCPSCRIVTTAGPLLTANNAGFFPFITVARDSRRRYIVAPLADRVRIAMFSNTGTLVRTVGRSGNQPGEFMYSGVLAVGPGDSIHVFDAFARRRTVLDSSMRIVRSTPLPTQFYRAITLVNGQTIGQGVSVVNPDAERTGNPLHAWFDRSAPRRSVYRLGRSSSE
jgi:hypothetical protein